MKIPTGCGPQMFGAALVMAVVIAGGATPACAKGPPPRTAQGQEVPTTFASALNRAAAWTVGVYGIDGSNDVREPRVGAGFFVDGHGGVVTSAHLVADATRMLVRLPDKRVVQAEVEGADAETDVALLRVPFSTPLAPAFASSARLQLGDWVLAVGEPYGLARSVSAGIVSGKDRHFIDDREVLFIQTDLALNPGNSGGPLLDASGAIVGMNTRTVSGPEGLAGPSLSVPSEIVLQIVDELQGRGAGRPRLGAYFDDLSAAAAWAAGRGESGGVEIVSVPHGSLAEEMDLRIGDIVIEMNGRVVRDSAGFTRALLAWRTLDGTRVTVLRGGEQRLLTTD
jgi:S1-C subfamily serine protease